MNTFVCKIHTVTPQPHHNTTRSPISGNGENPLENVPYFKKGVDTAFKVSEYSSFMAPKNCQEYVYRIYLKTKGKEIEKAREIWNSIMM